MKLIFTQLLLCFNGSGSNSSENLGVCAHSYKLSIQFVDILAMGDYQLLSTRWKVQYTCLKFEITVICIERLRIVGFVMTRDGSKVAFYVVQEAVTHPGAIIPSSLKR